MEKLPERLNKATLLPPLMVTLWPPPLSVVGPPPREMVWLSVMLQSPAKVMVPPPARALRRPCSLKSVKVPLARAEIALKHRSRHKLSGPQNCIKLVWERRRLAGKSAPPPVG